MYYNEKHSVTFVINGETKNTHTDWHLVPTQRPFVAPPETRKFTQTIDTHQGVIDYYKDIIGYPIYENRTGELKFLVNHDSDDYITWYYTLEEVMNFLHGQHGKMYLDDQPDWYYEGLFQVSTYEPNSDWSVITISYDVSPQKKYITSSQEPWLWDPFSFITGIIRNGEDYVFTLSATEPSKEFEVTDVRGVSNVALEILGLDDDLLMSETISIFLSYWGPVMGEIERAFNVNGRNIFTKEFDNVITFPLYPGHSKFRILIIGQMASNWECEVKVHFREGML